MAIQVPSLEYDQGESAKPRDDDGMPLGHDNGAEDVQHTGYGSRLAEDFTITRRTGGSAEGNTGANSNYEAGYNGSGNSSMGGVAGMLEQGTQHGLAANHHMSEGLHAASDADRAIKAAEECYQEADSHEAQAAKAQKDAEDAAARAAAAEEENERAAAEDAARRARERVQEFKDLANEAKKDARTRLTRAKEIGNTCLNNFTAGQSSIQDARHVFRGALMGTTNHTGLQITELANELAELVSDVLSSIEEGIKFVGNALNGDRLPQRDYNEKFVTSVEALIPEEKAAQAKMLGVLAAEYAVMVLL